MSYVLSLYVNAIQPKEECMKHALFFLFVCASATGLRAMHNQELEQAAIDLAAISQSEELIQQSANFDAQKKLSIARQKGVKILPADYRDANSEIFNEIVKYNSMKDEDLHVRGEVGNW